jgi:Prokaryotic glutathione synthetase, ATP-grasp domain
MAGNAAPEQNDSQPAPGCTEVKKIAFATCEKYPDLINDDRLVTKALQRHGIEVNPLIWDSDMAQDQSLSSIVIRSCWDYHVKPQQFLLWVRQTEERGLELWNPARAVEWNLNKIYLRDLKRMGVATPETAWVMRNEQADLRTVLEERGWRKAVVKPLISATAFRTWVTSPETAGNEQNAFIELLSESGAIVQQFVEEVQTRGEWSFMFFGGKYSHAVLKKPKEGDFRVQEEYGGEAESVTPALPLIEHARRIVGLVPERLLFARVDAVEVDGKLWLMELELIEPFLFLYADPLAPNRFAEAIASLC